MLLQSIVGTQLKWWQRRDRNSSIQTSHQILSLYHCMFTDLNIQLPKQNPQNSLQICDRAEQWLA